METAVTPPVDAELHLLTEWWDPNSHRRWRQATVASVLVHIAGIVVLLSLPAGFLDGPPPRREAPQQLRVGFSAVRHGLADSRGSRKGIIVDLEKAVASIQKAAERAEDSCGFPIEHALLGIAGSHVRGINTHGGLAFTRAREIGREEIRMAVDKARAIPLPPDRDVLHLLPQEFILDEQHGVHDPLGMIATRLEVRVHMISAARSAARTRT